MVEPSMVEPSMAKTKRTLSQLEDETCHSPTFRSDNVTPAKRTKSISSRLPEVFEMDELTHDQRLAAYLTIFQHCTPVMVIAALAECMRENIAKAGWSAVWKPKDFSSFILVQVEEAPVVDGFQARIRVDDSESAVESQDEAEGGQTNRAVIETYLSVHAYTVSLTELNPVYDESGYLDDTALALEHLRFFMDYLWRLSDEEDEGSYSFLERTLVPRLKFYYEMAGDALPESLVTAYTEAMREYKEKQVLLSKMQSQLSDSDSESEDLNESRTALSIMIVHQELENLETKMERMENPTLRHLVMSLTSLDGLSSSPKSLLAQKLQTRISESGSEVVTHLVGERVTAGMIQDLHLPREIIIQSHTSINDAVSSADDGDIVLLFPGNHSASGLSDFHFALTFIGLGNPEDTVISCRGLVDALDLSGSSVSFQNIKFYDEQCSWLLSSSNSKSFEAINCIFEGGGVQLYGNGEMKLEECEIFGGLAYGVCILSGSRASLRKCNVHNNGSCTGEDCGILIEIDTREHMDSTLVEIIGSRIHHNQGPGLLMVDSDEGQKTYQAAQLENLEAIINFKGTLDDNSFANNVGGDFKHSVRLTIQDEKLSEIEYSDHDI